MLQSYRASAPRSLRFTVIPSIATCLYFLTLMTVCSGADMTTIEELSFTEIDRGFMSGLRERKFLLIKSTKQWKELWASHVSGFITPKPLPSVDFDKEMIVAVSSGEKATGGYGIQIAKIEALQPKRALLITVVDSKPPADAVTSQALTQPYHIVKVKRVDLQPRFTVR